MTVGRLAVSLPCRENGEDGEAAVFCLVAFGGWPNPGPDEGRHGGRARIKINRHESGANRGRN